MVADHSHRVFVVTGGPGSGKSSLIDALAAQGFARSVEAGRGIIQDQVAIGGRALPWADRLAFAELMLSWEMRSYGMARDQAGPVIFDRGVPDIIGYLHVEQLSVPAHMDKAARIFRYSPRVFIAPPWPEIFVQDAERKQTFEEAERTYRAIHLPLAPVESRVRFLVEQLRESASQRAEDGSLNSNRLQFPR